MAIVSIFLGLASFLLMIGGVLATGVPIVGAVLSFGSPVVALAGIITGGVAVARAKRAGNSSGAAITGLVLSSIGFLLSLIVALTCGLCNACISSNESARRGSDDVIDSVGATFDRSAQRARGRQGLTNVLEGIYERCARDPSGARGFVHTPTIEVGTLCAEVTSEVVENFSACRGVATCDTRLHVGGQLGVADTVSCFDHRHGRAELTICHFPDGPKLVRASGLASFPD